MPLKIGQILPKDKRQAVPFDVAVGDGRLMGTYYPGRITLGALAGLGAQNDILRQVDAMIGYVLGLIASWDLTDNDGAPIPLTREALEQFQVEELTAITQALQAEQSVDPTSLNGSGRASRR